jgi:hypothetical protein
MLAVVVAAVKEAVLALAVLVEELLELSTILALQTLLAEQAVVAVEVAALLQALPAVTAALAS